MEVVKKEDTNVVTVADLSSSSSISEVSLDTSLPKLASVQGRTTGPTRRSTKGGWTEQEDDMLTKAVKLYNGKNWKKIAECFPGRSDVQCLHRWQKVLNPDLVKGPWSKEEDECILDLVGKYGFKKWSVIAQSLPGRIGKQCRERWHNHLNPAIKKHAWAKEEERALIRAHQIYGNKWAEIAKFLPGRADNSIKNHWNCSVKKKLDSYLASEFARAYNLEEKDESIKLNVSAHDEEILCPLGPKKYSDHDIDFSLGVSVLGVSHGEQKELQSHFEPIQCENRCLEEEIDCQKEFPIRIRFECESPIASKLSSELFGEDGNYSFSSDVHHCSVETEVSCGISSGDPINHFNSSPGLSEELSLSLSCFGDALNGMCGRKNDLSLDSALPFAAKRTPETPKRPRHYASCLHESRGLNSKSSVECYTLFPNLLSGECGHENGHVQRKGQAVATPLLSKDISFGPLFYEPPERANPGIVVKNVQLASSPLSCSTPPSSMRSTSVNDRTPETILRTAAKNFKNTPSIIRKRSRGTSGQDCNAIDFNDVCMSEVRSGSFADTQGSPYTCDRVVADQKNLASTHLLDVKWLSLSSPSLQPELDVSTRSVEKCLEYAFDLAWDNSKARCSDTASESDSIGEVSTSNMDLTPSNKSADSSKESSNHNFLVLGLGIDCDSVI